MLYVYACGRDDGFRFAVGEVWDGEPANGGLALFQEAEDARMFAYARAALADGKVIILPSAQATQTGE